MIQLSYFVCVFLVKDLFCGTKVKVICQVKVIYQGHIFQKMAVTGALMFHKPTLFYFSDKFYNFQRIAAWDDIFQTLLAVSIFFSILKLIHLLRFNRRMSLLARTLKQSGREMAAFSIVLFLFMLAFASCGHLLFGANVYGFSNMLRGFETLTAFSLGSYDFNYLTRNNRFLGPMFFFVYFTFVAFVLINMFVTILNDAVTVVHHDVLKQTNEYEILEFLLSKLKSWLHIDLQKVILDVKRKYVPGKTLYSNTKSAGFV